jgi:hypothetical protein
MRYRGICTSCAAALLAQRPLLRYCTYEWCQQKGLDEICNSARGCAAWEQRALQVKFFPRPNVAFGAEYSTTYSLQYCATIGTKQKLILTIRPPDHTATGCFPHLSDSRVTNDDTGYTAIPVAGLCHQLSCFWREIRMAYNNRWSKSSLRPQQWSEKPI